MLLMALKDNIDKYEKRFGEISINTLADQHFGFVPPVNEKVN